MTTTIIGIDCATQAKNVGLALGSYEEGAACIEQVLLGSVVDSLVQTVADWTKHSPAALLAQDAPLGWPVGLGCTLYKHEAGRPIALEANLAFRRETDRFVKQEIGKQPLEVGANWIARTVHAALGFLEELRQATAKTIPLAWEPSFDGGVYAIEVYPAATLAAYGVKASGYKGKDHRAQRAHGAVLGLLEDRVALPHDRALIENHHDVLDAALCVLAGVDFLRCETLQPTDPELARKEGWIWVRRPSERPAPGR